MFNKNIVKPNESLTLKVCSDSPKTKKSRAVKKTLHFSPVLWRVKKLTTKEREDSATSASLPFPPPSLPSLQLTDLGDGKIFTTADPGGMLWVTVSPHIRHVASSDHTFYGGLWCRCSWWDSALKYRRNVNQFSAWRGFESVKAIGVFLTFAIREFVFMFVAGASSPTMKCFGLYSPVSFPLVGVALDGVGSTLKIWAPLRFPSHLLSRLQMSLITFFFPRACCISIIFSLVPKDHPGLACFFFISFNNYYSEIVLRNRKSIVLTW